MKCMMTKFDNDATKHRNMETQRHGHAKTQRQDMQHKMQQCKMQCATNMNKWKCQHHQRCYAVNTTIKACEVQTKTKT